MNKNLLIKSTLGFIMLLLIVYTIGCSNSAGMSTGAVKGVLQDITGNALENARIHIEFISSDASVPGPSTAISRVITTHTDGSFVVPDLPAGTWRMGMIVEGYQSPTLAANFQTDGSNGGSIIKITGVTPELKWPVNDENYPIHVEDGATFNLPLIYVTKREGSTNPGNISGNIIHLITGEKITGNNATVSIVVSAYEGSSSAGTPNYTVLADSNGEFEFTGLKSGQWTIKAFKDNFDSSGSNSEITLTIPGGTTLSDINLPMTPKTINLQLTIQDDSTYGSATGGLTLNGPNIVVFCTTTGQEFTNCVTGSQILLSGLYVLDNPIYKFKIYYSGDPNRFNLNAASGSATPDGTSGFQVSLASITADSTFNAGTINLQCNTITVSMRLFFRDDEENNNATDTYNLTVNESDTGVFLKAHNNVVFTTTDPDNNDQFCYMSATINNVNKSDAKQFQIVAGVRQIDLEDGTPLFEADPDDVKLPAATVARAYVVDTFVGISMEIK